MRKISFNRIKNIVDHLIDSTDWCSITYDINDMDTISMEGYENGTENEKIAAALINGCDIIVVDTNLYYDMINEGYDNIKECTSLVSLKDILHEMDEFNLSGNEERFHNEREYNDMLQYVVFDSVKYRKFYVGDKVKWNDPNIGEFSDEDAEIQKDRVWVIDNINGEVISISDDFGEAEVDECELMLI